MLVRVAPVALGCNGLLPCRQGGSPGRSSFGAAPCDARPRLAHRAVLAAHGRRYALLVTPWYARGGQCVFSINRTWLDGSRGEPVLADSHSQGANLVRNLLFFPFPLCVVIVSLFARRRLLLLFSPFTCSGLPGWKFPRAAFPATFDWSSARKLATCLINN